MNRRGIVLLVEDNDDDVVLALRAFRQSGLFNEVVIARDGQEALDYLFGTGARAGRPLKPDVVLLDLNLPKLDGLDVLRAVRGNPMTKHFPTVMLTSSNQDSDRLRSYDLGVNSFVRKPVDFGEFIEAVRQLGLYWLVLNQPAERRD